MKNNVQTLFDWERLPANRYDVAAKQSTRAYPNDMLRLILGTSDFEFVAHLDTELPAVDVRQMDSLTKIRLEGELTLIHREYQLHDSYPIPIERRVAGYRGRCHEDSGLPIRSYVIYFQPPAGRRDPGGYFQNVNVPGQRFISEYEVIRLYEWEGGPVLEAALPGLMPFVPLMQPPAGVDSVAWLRQCDATTRQLPLDTASIDNLLMSTGIFGNLLHAPATVFSIISEEDVRHSSIFQYLMQKPMEEALQEGIQQGIQQGMELGERKNAVDALMDVLETRFENSDVQLLKPTFESITDLQRLKHLHHTALRAPTLDAVLRTLVQNGA